MADVVRRVWGYERLRPLQREAMDAAAAGRDALVVLPTGGGKSLCYQAPAVLAERPTVVVSPLIALMKDQVDALIQREIPAAFLNSSLSPDDRRRVIQGIRKRAFKLIFVAPERFAGGFFFDLLAEIGVGAFAIDEAHCISHWGHDFRADYRQLGQLRQRFADTPIHAFTATATPRVREDIVAQLGLHEPDVLVGDFFRPNLTYRAKRRQQTFDDVITTVRAHDRQGGIVYCIRRADVDALAARLAGNGVRAIGYHAGMSDNERTDAQDAFAAGNVDVVVATVAFGMGIDRSDIRFVVHAAMPRSIEHYQQETGRAGRDGQPAECVLYYSGADYGLWKSILSKDAAPNFDEQMAMLNEMYRFCTAAGCRHRQLVSYFGQAWDRDGCAACDYCNGEMTSVPDATVISQKVLSCVARTGERFGATHIVRVLRGEDDERIQQRGHDQLSTFGLLGEHSRPELMAWIDQLVEQNALRRDGEYRVLAITPDGWRIMRGDAEATLYAVETGPQRATRRRKPAKRDAVDLPKHTQPGQPLDVDARRLFDQLRALRHELATEVNRPAFFVCSDRTLREIARERPTTHDQLLAIDGIGPAKLDAFGDRFLQAIQDFERQQKK